MATPLEWEEAGRGGLGPRDWTIRNVLERLAHRPDPWSGMMRHARSASARRERLQAMLAREEPAEEELD
ncbi:MAG: hypothetical protein AB7Y46_12675 [Armatimonadota bacterium]